MHGEKQVENALRQIRGIADYQFGQNVGTKLFPDNVEFVYSPATKRIRFINLNGKRLATLRPTDSLLSLSVTAAKFLVEHVNSVHCLVVVRNDVAKFVADGGDVFAVHVVKADEGICPKDEVIAVDEDKRVLAVGRALLSASEMLAFKVGVAVKVRHGSGKS